MPTRPSSEDHTTLKAPSRSRAVARLIDHRNPEPPAVTLDLAETHGSTEQLKQTIVAMRQQIEQLHIEKQRSAQEALAVAHDEIAQLKRTIVAMREELERRTPPAGKSKAGPRQAAKVEHAGRGERHR
jgi:hypothetical protein